MAVIRTRADDVLLATRGQTVGATRERRLAVPKEATENGKSLRVTLDVSDQGDRELNALIKKAEDDTRKAWGPVMAVVRKRLGPEAGTNRAPKAQEAPAPREPEQSAPHGGDFPSPATEPGHPEG